MSLGDVLLGDVFKSEAAMGTALGVGVAILAPVVLAAASGMGRPLMRAAVKSGTVLYEKGRETAAEFGEVMEDFVAEVRAEYAAAGPAKESGLTPVQAEVAATVKEAVQEAETRYGRK